MQKYNYDITDINSYLNDELIEDLRIINIDITKTKYLDKGAQGVVFKSEM